MLLYSRRTCDSAQIHAEGCNQCRSFISLSFIFSKENILIFNAKMSFEDLTVLWNHIISLSFTAETAISNISLGLKSKRRRTICLWVP